MVETIIEKLQIEPYKKVGQEQIVICPFCSQDKKRPKMYINIEKGVFHCHRCHTSGNLTQLWAMMTGTDTKTAYRQLKALETPEIVLQKVQKDTQPPSSASPEKTHQVYKEFLSKLTLHKEHKDNLLKRGLSNSYIQYFKSLPEDAKRRWNICRNLNLKYGLEDVPGFIKRTSKNGTFYWDCIGSGMLIPIKDVKGRYTSFQVRTDGEPKYIFFSYAGQLKSSAHIIPGEGIPWIIEGTLKSYVTHSFLNVPCIGIPGTNAYKTIPTGILRGGRVILAYDIEDNPYTIEAKAKCIKHLENSGLQVICASWNPRLGKGIDDACLSLKKGGKRLSPEMFIPGIKPA